ncbi:protein NETWORKED 4B-like [Phragmites australis]|uniref:protein NETWORKED 4B-like n=1 Tax=Phragmites australis TaxID=29695 RepID=UPI002D78B881|nr:protein NETWORKED 4B-like [Phragmites australis]
MKRMHRMPTRKSHSWWWDSHISPKNNKWLAENLEEMDKQVKEMLRLIEDEGDSFAKKAEMYFQRRPLLVTHVENFYRMYRALAERYDNVTGELRKNIPSSLQSQGSGISEADSETHSTSSSPEPNTEQKTPKQKRKTRAAGFDVFLGSGGSSDISKKGSDGSSSSSDSDSEVDEEREEDGNGISYALNERIIELEEELQEARQQLEALEEKNMRCQCEKLEESFKRVSSEKEDLVAVVLANKNEIEGLKGDMTSAAKHYEAQLLHHDHEIEKCKQELEQVSEKYFHEKSTLEAEIRKLQEVVMNFEGDLAKVSGEKLQLESQLKELEQASRSLDDSSAEMMKLQEITKDLQARLENGSNEKTVLEERAMEFEQVHRQLEDSWAEARKLQATIDSLKDDLDRALQEKLMLQDRAKDLEQATSDLNASVAHNQEKFSMEKSSLSSEILKLSEANASLEGKLTSTESQLEQLHAEKAETSLESEKQISELNQAIADLKTKLELLSSEKSAVDNRVYTLLIDVTTRDEKMKEMGSHLHQLHLEHAKLIEEADVARKAVSDLRARVCELEEEVEKQKLMISDSAEGKREAIRQLCFSLDHYRHGYQHLRQLLQGHRRPMVMAT